MGPWTSEQRKKFNETMRRKRAERLVSRSENGNGDGLKNAVVQQIESKMAAFQSEIDAISRKRDDYIKSIFDIL